MLIDVRSLTDGQPCAILGVGHTVLPEDCRYDNFRFITKRLSPLGRNRLEQAMEQYGGKAPAEELHRRANTKFLEVAGIQTRMISSGNAADLGVDAARLALADAKVGPDQIDAILVGTNTGMGYASTADHIKEQLRIPISAKCFDAQEACSIGGIIVEEGWEKIRSRRYRHVLVVGSEKATTLASADDYKGANLFGDAAFAMVLGPAERDNFIFFDSGSDPYEKRLHFIERRDGFFYQNGREVHKFVCKVVPEMLDQIFQQLKINPATIHHFFPHQPSVRTLDTFLEHLQLRWPGFTAKVHRNVAEMGNTSGACTGWMISRAKAAGELQPGQFCVVATFGSGMSWGLYGFIVR